VFVARTGKRIPAAARRDKIVEVTLRLVADEGIEGATTARIAAASGVSEGTLYRLFGSKRGILLAAVDAVHDNFLRLMETSRRGDPITSLQELGRLHTESMVGSGVDHFIAPLFAFMTAPVSMGLREAVARRQQEIIDLYSQMLEQARAAGEIPEGADVRQTAWTFAAIFWAEDLSALLGLPGFVLEGRAKKALDATLRCFVRCGGCPETAENLPMTLSTASVPRTRPPGSDTTGRATGG
jgi:AcrR family transcriptional regulator